MKALNGLRAPIVTALMMTGAVRASEPDVESVAKLMPSGYPVTAIVVNFEKLDKGVTAFGKAVDPTSEPDGLLADLKRQVGLAEWIDFAKPVGMMQASFGNSEPILFASVPKFTEKVKNVAGAKEEDGVWHVPYEGKDDLYAVVKGDIVVVGSDREELKQITQKEGKRLADEIKPRLDLLKDRDALVHLDFEPIRPLVAGQITQAAQMAPMFAMMAAQQGGADAGAMTAVITGAIDGIRNFIEQVSYLDLAIGISSDAVNATMAAGFGDGPIKSYLAKTKPASSPLMNCFEDEPFTLAMGWHVPGSESPFFDYFFEKMASAIPAPMGQPTGEDGKSAGDAGNANKEATTIARDLYRKVEGQNVLMSMSGKGLVTKGNYIGSDAKAILELSKQTMTKVNPVAKIFSGGASYEAAGTKSIDGATVDEFAVKLDPNHPASAEAAKMFGENLRILMGMAGGSAAYHMGPESDAKKFFAGKVDKPLTANKQVAETLAAMPPRRNAVILFDLGGAFASIAPMLGMPAPTDIPPSPPAAISLLLSGDYARADVHVPSKAIRRIVESTSSQPPM